MIRVVGNVVDSTVLASMHYAVSHLNVPLVVVLGHTGCGAVNAAINDKANGLIKPTIDKIKLVIGNAKRTTTLQQARMLWLALKRLYLH